MRFYLFLSFICHFYQSTSTKIKLELKKNILNFGYGINYKYEGMLVQSFNRFYGVTKFILPSIGDLKFSKFSYDNACTYFDNMNSQTTETRNHVRSNNFLPKDRTICNILQKIDKVMTSCGVSPYFAIPPEAV